MISVTGTENLMMAATLAQGTTKLINAAREPEIVDLGLCLQAMGANIEGLGTDTITIHGVTSLHGANHRIVPDRIETGTYLMAACMTGGTLDILNTRLDLLPSLDSILTQAGAKLSSLEDGIRIEVNHRLKSVDAVTEPYPGLATDFQAQVMTIMTIADGASMITENIFENRFMHVPELARMGADITVHGSSAMVRGVEHLTGAPVMATDLRASVSLVMAGLAAQGETTVSRIYHLDRGYERLEEKLSACGADIERIHGE
jgi:UDP-N-acetylglucosamine 1-carboxyvinyltransferase